MLSYVPTTQSNWKTEQFSVLLNSPDGCFLVTFTKETREHRERSYFPIGNAQTRTNASLRTTVDLYRRPSFSLPYECVYMCVYIYIYI